MVKPATTVAKSYSVYIVRCADGSLYTGIARNVEKRVKQHNSGQLGAKYTRSRQPVELAYSHGCIDRSAALKAEVRIKKLSRQRKLQLISGGKLGLHTR